jgi:hypothetical protein
VCSYLTYTYTGVLSSGNFSPIELDNLLLKNTDSIELALSYAKTWSKYTKNIVSWVEKKLNLGEFSVRASD